MRWLKSQPDNRARPPDYVSETSSFLNNLRSDRIEGNHEHAEWVALSGTIRLKPVSVAVLCHADSFRAPQAARLHPTKPYFCFAPCVDGSFTIDKEHPFRARYRYVITDAATDALLLDQHWQAWHKD
ncbi:MAG: PmoA family protein [Planctomycetes bacterium]|nr:PmoA family protein [Planctomycetota bacterium]